MLEVALNEYLDACQGFQIANPNSISEAHELIDVIPSTITPECLANEYTRITLLEKKIQRTKAVLEISRNRASVITPVDSLPAEVLIHILRLVAESESCELDPWSPGYGGLPKYPVLLTHVCTRWRRIIIDIPLFWSHIDAIPLMHTDERIRNRTQTFVARAGHSTLDIHITTPYPTDEDWEAAGLSRFLVPLVPRMRSLNLEIIIDENVEDYEVESPTRNFCASILSVCFGPGCVPGTLTRFQLRVDTLVACLFLEGVGNVRHDDYLFLDVPAQHLEDIWQHITVLRLKALFPFWSSTAYSGLVELRLDGRSYLGGTPISEHQFANILSSSPRLRVMIIDLPITPAITPYSPVLLADLDTLVLQSRATRANSLEHIIRLLIPGPKPLHATIDCKAWSLVEEDNVTETAKFFSRSNITTLHLLGAGNVSRLIGSVSTIQALALTISTREDVESLLAGEKPSNLYLQRLHILNRSRFEFGINVLSQLVKIYAPLQLLLRGPYHITRGEVHLTRADEIQQELSNLGCSTEVLLLALPDFKHEPLLLI
ncbi:hypothetical protein RSOLAG1IB_07879 [Rhizoctonia solani AG-1 IB]|uniref:Uncharacterized protein n=1 Tax=Thanatephorus cucumeris (strain AG1-IB / isolate 7/3/14) TaxID=1108050 RepID=A0A0B7FFY0_THACB|nr:hypothetical protein RSOLAG1IB_07879 [Rhizoctonia solani AG-1 IB]